MIQAAGRLLGPAAALACALMLACVRPPAAQVPAPAGRSPNVVLVVIDTLRADRVGAFSSTLPEDVSPELDALAESGVRFTNTVAQSSWTRSSIGSLLTSRYPRSLGIDDERSGGLAPAVTTLAESLSQAGWATFGATANPHLNRVYGFDQGFDEYVESDVLWGWMPPRAGATVWGEAALPSASELFSRAERFVEARDPARPFFVLVTIMEVHEYSEQPPDAADDASFLDRPDAPYLRAVRKASAEVGAFRERLARLVDPTETLFIVVSDHGEGLRSHPSVQDSSGHGLHVYRSQTHVPFLLSHPGSALPAGRTVRRPVRLLDLAPTVLDYLSLPPSPDAEGLSLLPLLEPTPRPVALPERFVVETRFQGQHSLGVYGGEWRYYEHGRPLPGQRARELQAVDGVESGASTDLKDQDPGAAEGAAAVLADWLHAHPQAAGTPQRPLDPAAEEQLKALGYTK